MHQVDLDEAKTRLPDLVDAAVKGEDIFILVEGRPVQLVPVPAPTRRARFGSARGLVTMADDFDAPLSDFDEYHLAQAMVEQIPVVSADPAFDEYAIERLW